MSDVHVLEIWLVLFVLLLIGYAALTGMPASIAELVRIVLVPFTVSVLVVGISSFLRRL